MHVLFLHVFCDFRLIRTAFTAKKAHRLYRHLLLNAARWHGNARVGLYFVIRLYMIVQASFRGEAFGTTRTLKRFCSGMRSHVNRQMTLLSITFITKITRKRFLSGMCTHVTHQITLLHETFGTQRARKRPFTRVNAKMHRLMTSSGESFGTEQTRIRLLSRMCSHVSFQTTFLSKHLVTHQTRHRLEIYQLVRFVVLRSPSLLLLLGRRHLCSSVGV